MKKVVPLNNIQLITKELINKLSVAGITLKKMRHSSTTKISTIKSHIDDSMVEVIAKSKTSYSVELLKKDVSFVPYFNQLAEQYKVNMTNLNKVTNTEKASIDSVTECGLEQLDLLKFKLDKIGKQMEEVIYPNQTLKK